MAAHHVTIGDLENGLPVEYLGEQADRDDVLDDRLVARGMALFPGHPGRIFNVAPQHVQVSWTGLEDEPASFAVGFCTPDALTSDAHYQGLGRLSETEFAQRDAAVRTALADLDDLSRWCPPWRASPW